MENIIITGEILISGVSISDQVADAGYSPLSKGMNHLKERGVLYFQPSRVSLGAIDGNLIATLNDPNFLSNAAYLLTDNGSLYTLDGSLISSGLTLRQTDSTGTHDYSFGTSDMIWYQGALYVTCNIDIMRVTGANLTGSVDKAWWVTTKGKTALNSTVRHPMEVIEDTLYIADNNNIHTWDGTTAVENAIALPPNFNITHLNKHPNGRDLIAFGSQTIGASNTYQAKGSAFIIDTVTGEYTQQIGLDDQVEGAKLVGGILYVVYGTKLGYFTETGTVFLRDLDFTYPLTSTQLGYKHHLGNMEGSLLLIENKAILSLGDLGAGKVWSYPVVNSGSNDDIKGMLYIGSKKLLYGSDDGAGQQSLFTLDFSISASGSFPIFYTNKYQLPKKAWIRRIEIEHENFATNGTLTVSAKDTVGNLTNLGSTTQASGVTNFSRIECNYNTSIIQLAIQVANHNLGIKKITIYYEYGEI